MTPEDFQQETLDSLTRLQKLLETQISGGHNALPQAETYVIGATQSNWYYDYKGRKHVYLFSANAITLNLNDLGTLAISANTWTDVTGLRPGMQIFRTTGAAVSVWVICTNETIAAATAGTAGSTAVTAAAASYAVGWSNEITAILAALVGTLNVAVTNVNANGVAASVNSAPVVSASDDANWVDLLQDTEQLTAMAADLADVDANTDLLVAAAGILPGAQGWIAPTGTGTATTDDSLTFASQVRKVALYNAASVPVPLEFDQTAAATSWPIQPGQALVFDNVLCTVIHVFPSALLPINTTAGLYVKGFK